MKNTFLFMLISILVLVGIQCKSGKETTTKTEPVEQLPWILEFGSGGGFTGSYTSYFIYQSGEVYELKSEKEGKTTLSSLTKDEAAFYLKQAKTAEIESLHYNKPGNMNKYIQLTEGEHVYRLTWTFDGENPSTPIKDLYNDLSKLIRKLKYAE